MYKISKRYQYICMHTVNVCVYGCMCVCVFIQPEAWVTVPQQMIVFFNNSLISPYNFLSY